MYFVIGTVDGKEHYGKQFTMEELQGHLDSVDGYIGSGEYAAKQFTAEGTLDLMEEMLKYDKQNDTQTFTLELSSGDNRTFNVSHVVWWELRGRE